MQEVEILLESIKSEVTKKQYEYIIKKWIEFIGEDNVFCDNNPRLIEAKIIEYLIQLKKTDLSSAAISNYIVPIKSFYSINDVTLNIQKLGKFMPEYRRKRPDRAYTHSEIQKMLEIADERMRVVILVLASSGIRIGALPLLRLKHLQDTKLVIYEKDSEEYFTFITTECNKAVDTYLDMRLRYGEKLGDESYLVREPFDLRNPGKPKQFKKNAIQYKIYDLCRRCGINKKDVSVAHGFRKFFTNQCVKSKVNPEIREMLLGHKIGLMSSYYRPTEQEMLEEYEKAEDNLTIDPSNRLRKELETAKVEKSRLDRIEQKMNLMEKMFQK